MSKIVTAVNAMISHPELISSVQYGGDTESELFFMYNKKHKWSIANSHDCYQLFYYTIDEPLYRIAEFGTGDWGQRKHSYIMYDTDILGTREAKSTFKELYQIVDERALGMDKILDEIIDSGF